MRHAAPGFRALLAVALLWVGCATAPKHSYAVKSVDIRGMEEMDERALLACLATQERDKVRLGVGRARDLTCNEPPFDSSRAGVSLFAWPWTPYPRYDEALLKLDLSRVERWYQARGFYDAQVVRVRVDPQRAESSDRVDCKRPPCQVSITIELREGEPVMVRNVRVDGAQSLPEKLQKELTKALELKQGTRFDEALYEESKTNLLRILREAGYARAQVQGDAAVHRGLLWADLTFRVTPGRLCKIGKVVVTSSSPVPIGPIKSAAKLKRGELYRESDLDDAQRAVFALGAFSSVAVRGDLTGDSEWVDIRVEVTPRRKSEWLLGVGVMSGLLTTGPLSAEWVSVPQWDLHLLGRYEHRNFFGKLRHFHIEERPRLLFLDAFPRVPDNSPRFGNALEATFSQPGVIERRTRLFAEARWEHGPDPFLLFFRHDFGVSVGLERAFFRRKLTVAVALHQDIMEVSRRQPIVDAQPVLPEGSDDEGLLTIRQIPSSYRLPFFEQRVVLDLRDDAVEPTKGAYLGTSIHEAVRLWEPSWNYIRITPEARVYAPIGLGMVLAARFAVGMIHILSASSDLDAISRTRGPQLYRLRGGGAQSNRGFAPGRLGVGLLGGIRRWESSLELRIPLNKNLTMDAFSDMGDVNDEAHFRFRHLNTAVGGGLRYRTIIGPVRLDCGYRPRALHGDAPSERETDLGLFKFRGAIHLTIGESF